MALLLFNVYLLGVAYNSRTLGCGVVHSTLTETTQALRGRVGDARDKVRRSNRASILETHL